MNKLKSQQGLTLVEVLAALVILGIVFVGIMTVFPQMTLFNNKTEAKLDTMNLARQEMVYITSPSNWEKKILLNPADPTTNVPIYLTKTKIEDEMNHLQYLAKVSTSTAQYLRFEKKSEKYLFEVDIYLKCETYTNTPLTSQECEESEKNKLHKVHLKIMQEATLGNEDYLLSSETFSYLIYSAINEDISKNEGE